MISGPMPSAPTTAMCIIRAEYPLAVERLHRALTQAREQGFLGNKIFKHYL